MKESKGERSRSKRLELESGVASFSNVGWRAGVSRVQQAGSAAAAAASSSPSTISLISARLRGDGQYQQQLYNGAASVKEFATKAFSTASAAAVTDPKVFCSFLLFVYLPNGSRRARREWLWVVTTA